MKQQDLDKIHSEIIEVYKKYNVQSTLEIAASLKLLIAVVELTQVVRNQKAKEKENHETD